MDDLLMSHLFSLRHYIGRDTFLSLLIYAFALFIGFFDTIFLKIKLGMTTGNRSYEICKE